MFKTLIKARSFWCNCGQVESRSVNPALAGVYGLVCAARRLNLNDVAPGHPQACQSPHADLPTKNKTGIQEQPAADLEYWHRHGVSTARITLRSACAAASSSRAVHSVVRMR